MLSVVVVLQSLLGERLRHDDRGIAAVEYGLLLFVVVLVIIGGVGLVGQRLEPMLVSVANAL